MMREPMSAERLAEIYDQAIRDNEQALVLDSPMARSLAQARDDRDDVIAEVWRLRALLADRERLLAQADRQAAAFVEQRGKLYEAMDNLATAQEKARFYALRVDAYMAENIHLKAREAAWLAERERLLAVARAVARLDDDGDCMYCEYEAHVGHESACPVAQARAALAAADAPERD